MSVILFSYPITNDKATDEVTGVKFSRRIPSITGENADEKFKRMVVDHIAPDGEKLALCAFHSGPIHGDQPDRKDTTGYAFWTSDFMCYDTCWKEVEVLKAKDKVRNLAISALIRERDADVNATDELLSAFETTLRQLDEAKHRLADLLREDLEANTIENTPSMKNLQTILLNSEEQLRSARVRAEQKWSLRPPRATPYTSEEKEAFILSQPNVADALRRVNINQKKIANLEQSGALEEERKIIDAQLREKIALCSKEIESISQSIPTVARRPFHKIYTMITQIKKYVPAWDDPHDRTHRDALRLLRDDLKVYETQLSSLSKYIPASTHATLFETLEHERAAQAKAAAALLALAKLSKVEVSTKSKLGQLFIDCRSRVTTASADAPKSVGLIVKSTAAPPVETTAASSFSATGRTTQQSNSAFMSRW